MARNIFLPDADALLQNNRILLAEAKEMREAAREVVARAGRLRLPTPTCGAERQNRSGETLLALAQRHVLDGERRVARQRAIIEELERHHHTEIAATARYITGTIEVSLQLSRQHFERLREADGPHPMGTGAL
jgi:hypothetical protein